MEDTPRRRAEKRLSMLKNERTSWEANWRELSDFIQPMRSRLLCDQQANKGDRRNNKIINNEATEDALALAAGMMSGLTSRSRPWFNLEIKSHEDMEFGPVKDWLYEATERVRAAFLRSNFYNCMHVSYLEMGVFGTGAVWIDQDPDKVIACEAFTAGEYYVANGSDGKANTFYREFKLTAAQMAERFGEASLSDQAKNALRESRQDQWFDCVQMVETNPDYVPSSQISKRLAFIGLVWEKTSPSDKVLEHKGYHEFPVAVMRWDALPGDCYGTGPGRNCMGDVKALQLYERASARMAETGANPAVQAPAALRGQPSSMLPGGVTYVDQVGSQNSILPIYQPNYGWMQALEAKIQQITARIRRSFFTDLFLMISQMDDVRTATEIVARKEEKMSMLGPVVERIDFEGLDVIVDRTVGIMIRQSVPIWAGIIDAEPWLPEPPEELGDSEIEADYVSILAQAQKAQAVVGLERFASTIGNLSGVFPEARDKFNADQWIDEYAEAAGVVPTVVRGDEEVDAIRQQRAQQQQAQALQEQINQGIQGAKLLSETQITPDNVLGRMTGA
ncbi:portal protein [Pseudomonas sp. PSKL.D1]|uniref:portal protein n=1 Tax=Pseudomonas sp. PSKL.D1 TaxID=3029060 RepID=UPI0023814BE3|nr:portal protein [Pseudomonas sp. PSKL.D1]WDY60386.1 portal protein [Pseudomonas sp. PSKL.D1]